MVYRSHLFKVLPFQRQSAWQTTTNLTDLKFNEYIYMYQQREIIILVWYKIQFYYELSPIYCQILKIVVLLIFSSLPIVYQHDLAKNTI
jgi:hypothetical protein